MRGNMRPELQATGTKPWWKHPYFFQARRIWHATEYITI